MPNTSIATVAAAVVTTPALEWTQITLLDGVAVAYDTALAACQALGPGWRLPTLREQLSLVDEARVDPAIDVARFPDTKNGAYWTSTTHAFSDTDVWVVDFFSGATGNYRREGNFAFVRAVRTLPESEGASS